MKERTDKTHPEPSRESDTPTSTREQQLKQDPRHTAAMEEMLARQRQAMGFT